MSASIAVLLAFTAITLALPALIVSYRTGLVLTGKKAANAWPRDREVTDPPIFRRMADAHLNCLENLPLYAGVVLAAVALGQLPAIDALAPWLIAARIGQTTTHLISTSATAVFIRALFYSVQLILLVVMLVQLAF